MSPARLLKTINDELALRGDVTISKDVVVNRISSISDRILMRKRYGATAAHQHFQIIRDSYVVKNALDVVQIDHTKLDIMVVDPDTRECIGRPYLTLLLDVATRIPTGIYLSMDAPSATNLMMAFQRSVFPKAEYLASLGIQQEWPAYGLPLVISSDNGADLKSKAFNRGLDEYGVEHVFRPVGQPQLTHALIHTLIKNRVNLFVIRGLSQGQWGRDPTFQELRADFEPEQNAELDRLLLRFPANWY